MKVAGFVGPTYTMDSRQFDCQRSVNLIPLVSETGTSKSVTALRSAPGYKMYSANASGPGRGCKTAANGRGFIVTGNQLYELNTNGTRTLRGTLLTNTSRVSLAENGLQLMIVDGTFGYIFEFTTNTFTQITDIDFPTCEVVTFQDGYFIVVEKGTINFAISNLYDGLIWDPLDISSANSNPDGLISVISDASNLWLLGTQSVEVFQNQPSGSAFPFVRIPGAVIPTGCAAWDTVKAFDNTIAWLGVDDQGRGVVWKANGYAAQRISTQAIEAIIASSSDFTDSYAYVYHEQGHIYYCLQIQGLSSTLVFDGATGQWHERSFKDVATNTTQQSRVSFHLFFDQKNLIGDRLTGDIYEQSLRYFDHNGEAMHRERISPHIQDEKRNISFSSFELDVQTGVGLSAGQGSNPQIMMCYSDDGGETWSNEKWTTIGAIGKYKTRARWSRLGSGRDRVWKVRYTEPTFFQINEAYINAA